VQFAWPFGASWVLVVLLVGTGDGRASELEYRGSRVEAAARERGYSPLDVVRWSEGFAVSERGPGGFFLAWVDDDGARLELRQRLGPRPGDGVERLTSVQVDGEGPEELLWSVVERAPDEVVHWVAIFAREGDALRRVFDERFTVPESPPEAADERFGDAEPGWRIRAAEDGLRIVWVHGPRNLTVPGEDGPMSFTIGAEVTEHRWSGDGFVVHEAGYRDFLPPLRIRTADAPGDADRADASVVVDGRLASGWRFPVRGDGQRAAVTIQLEATERIRMIRIIPGCAESARAWRRHLEVGAFRLELGGAVRFAIDRRKPGRIPPGVRAWGEFPLTDRFGRQLVIFLARPLRAGWARFTPLAPLEPRRGARTACVSEIALH